MPIRNPAVQMNQPSPNWAPQPATSPSNAPGNPQLPPNGVMLPPNTPQQANAQANPQQIPGQQNRNMMAIPPRTGQTPLQQQLQHSMNQAQAQVAPQGSPNVSNMAQAMGGQPNGPPTAQSIAAQIQMHMQRSGPLPALPAPAFESAFKQWCQKQNIPVDQQLLTLDEGKKINLHALHQEVIAMGTIANVSYR